jgi:hypothetical protein
MRTALVIMAAAVLISAANLAVCALNGLPMWSAIAIFSGMVALFSINLSLYSKRKKENDDAE